MAAVTMKQAVTTWVDRWRGLRAWGRVLDTTKVIVRERRQGDYGTGRAFYTQNRIVVTVSGDDMPEALSTVLHEFAHIARPRRADQAWESHDEAWQACYASAVHEVTDQRIAVPLPEFKLLDRAAYDALKGWWRNSGNQFAWDLLRRAR